MLLAAVFLTMWCVVLQEAYLELGKRHGVRGRWISYISLCFGSFGGSAWCASASPALVVVFGDSVWLMLSRRLAL